MITLIYGAKGSGKTKKIIDAANANVGSSKGNMVFMGDNRYASEINTQIRFFNAAEYKLAGQDMTIGFIKGVLAGNFDITEFYIDGLHRITGLDADELKNAFDALDYISMQADVDFTISITAERLPEYLKKYI